MNDIFGSLIADLPLAAEGLVAARVNWEIKPDSTRRALAYELNPCLDSFVFIDDSEHERDLMHRACLQEIVPEMPGDPARRRG